MNQSQELRYYFICGTGIELIVRQVFENRYRKMPLVYRKVVAKRIGDLAFFVFKGLSHSSLKSAPEAYLIHVNCFFGFFQV